MQRFYFNRHIFRVDQYNMTMYNVTRMSISFKIKLESKALSFPFGLQFGLLILSHLCANGP